MHSKIKIFGHPVHPMLIAYPVAFYTGTLVGFIVYAATGDNFWLRVTIALNLAGIVTAAIAALPGIVDWLVGIPSGTAARRTGLIHAVFNVLALALFTTSFLIYRSDWDAGATAAHDATTGIILAATGVLSTILAGFQGWALIQNHHVGVNLSPEQARMEEQQQVATRRIA